METSSMKRSAFCFGRRIFAVAVIAVAVSAATPPAGSQTPTAPFRKVAIASKSTVEITGASDLGLRFTNGRDFQVNHVCLSFKNLDRRIATQIVFDFRYYNSIGDHNGDDVLTRDGKFTTGTTFSSYDARTGQTDPKTCVEIHFPRDGISLDAFWVQQVTYDDGSIWTAADLKLPEHLPNWHPAKPGSSPAPAPVASETPAE